jgi:proteasome lid subunit RPN8/RPN11
VIERLILPDAIVAQIEREARAAFRRECCGLIEGIRHASSSPVYGGGAARSAMEGGHAVEVVALHPIQNIAQTEDAFEIDPAAQIALLRRLRGTGREIVGCYHSHPNGCPEPSERDRAGAAEREFVWLIAALSGESGCTVKAFIFEGNDFSPLTCCEAVDAA